MTQNSTKTEAMSRNDIIWLQLTSFISIIFLFLLFRSKTKQITVFVKKSLISLVWKLVKVLNFKLNFQCLATIYQHCDSTHWIPKTLKNLFSLRFCGLVGFGYLFKSKMYQNVKIFVLNPFWKPSCDPMVRNTKNF